MTATHAVLVVRRATLDDAPAYARILGDADVLHNTMQLPHASVEVWRHRLTESLAPGKPDLLLVAERDGEVVGTAGLHPQTPLRRRHAAMLGITVAPAAQRQGVGGALMQAMCSWADGWAQILRIELTVFADNARAIALYERFGFVVEGRMRAYAMRDGAYADALAMARLHPRPPQLAG